jgi:hypothetical protein
VNVKMLTLFPLVVLYCILLQTGHGIVGLGQKCKKPPQRLDIGCFII